MKEQHVWENEAVFIVDAEVDDAVLELRSGLGPIWEEKVESLIRMRLQLIGLMNRMLEQPDLQVLIKNLRNHHPYTFRHSIGVAMLAGMIGEAIGMQDGESEELMAAGFLHDIGKTGIPVELLDKPGKLSAEEYACMQQHTLIGHRMLRDCPALSARYAAVALCHHERGDGSGYPQGLRHQEIDSLSQIVMIADVFHAMISKRAYKEPLPLYDVLTMLYKDAHDKLETTTTMKFLYSIMSCSIGRKILLANGETGIIAATTHYNPLRPIVQVHDGYLDLRRSGFVQIVRFL